MPEGEKRQENGPREREIAFDACEEDHYLILVWMGDDMSLLFQSKELDKCPSDDKLRVIYWMGEHSGKGDRFKRWKNYCVGMTLLDCEWGNDHHPEDVKFWANEIKDEKKSEKGHRL